MHVCKQCLLLLSLIPSPNFRGKLGLVIWGDSSCQLCCIIIHVTMTISVIIFGSLWQTISLRPEHQHMQQENVSAYLLHTNSDKPPLVPTDATAVWCLCLKTSDCEQCFPVFRICSLPTHSRAILNKQLSNCRLNLFEGLCSRNILNKPTLVTIPCSIVDAHSHRYVFLIANSNRRFCMQNTSPIYIFHNQRLYFVGSPQYSLKTEYYVHRISL